jgi:hypothetical protein
MLNFARRPFPNPVKQFCTVIPELIHVWTSVLFFSQGTGWRGDVFVPI